MKCKKGKVCNMCQATFKMERGCLLEKRCPACRLIGVSWKSDFPFRVSRQRILLHENGSTFHTWCFYPQNQLLETIQEWFGFEEQYMPSSEDIILEEEKNAITRAMLHEIKPREALAIEFIVMEDEVIQEAATALGISRERARQICSSGIKKLKHPRIGRPVKDYMENKL